MDYAILHPVLANALEYFTDGFVCDEPFGGKEAN